MAEFSKFDEAYETLWDALSNFIKIYDGDEPKCLSRLNDADEILAFKIMIDLLNSAVLRFHLLAHCNKK